MCWINSIIEVGTNGGTYVEGWVNLKIIPPNTNKFVPLLPFQHAWVERDGKIIDRTLPRDNLSYFPVFRYDNLHNIPVIKDDVLFPTVRNMGEDEMKKWLDVRDEVYRESLAYETGFVFAFWVNGERRFFISVGGPTEEDMKWIGQVKKAVLHEG